MMYRLNNEKGFTLIEAMIVVVILAILAGIAVPQYNQYVREARCSEAKVGLDEVVKEARLYNDKKESAAVNFLATAPIDVKKKWDDRRKLVNAQTKVYTITDNTSTGTIMKLIAKNAQDDTSDLKLAFDSAAGTFKYTVTNAGSACDDYAKALNQ